MTQPNRTPSDRQIPPKLWLSAALMSAVLTACGGGGGDTPAPTQPQPSQPGDPQQPLPTAAPQPNPGTPAQPAPTAAPSPGTGSPAPGAGSPPPGAGSPPAATPAPTSTPTPTPTQTPAPTQTPTPTAPPWGAPSALPPQPTLPGLPGAPAGPAPTPPPGPVPPPPQPLPPPANLNLPALGTPRTIVSQAATINRLRDLMLNNRPVARAFKEVVDSKVSGTNVYGMEPWHAALMGQVTNQTSYCTWAVAQTDAFVTAEEQKIAAIAASPTAPRLTNSGWVPPLPVVSGDSYLEVGPYIGGMAMVYDWCRPQTTQAQRTRWMNYGNDTLTNLWRGNGTQTWGGKTVTKSDWSINNPVNNYYYSFLEATMLLGLATEGENPLAGNWLTMFRTTKVENQLLPLFAQQLKGGGSREGTGYGTAMKNLWQIYDWWERSTGESLANRTPHTLESMAWLMHNIVPTRDRLAPTGDHARDQTAMLFDYHRDYLQKLISLYPNERISGSAKTMLAGSSVPAMTQHFMKYSDFLYEDPTIAARPLDELSTAYWGSGTGVFAMRNDWSTSSAYANFLCGARTESHAHRDNGSFVLFKGSWMAIDANIEGRSGLKLEEKYHNLVRFENSQGEVAEQRYTGSSSNNGGACNMQAVMNTPLWAYASAQITPMYSANQVTKSEREFVFIKPSTFVVFDRAQVPANSAYRPIFTMNFPRSATVTGDTMRYVQGSNSLDVKRLSPNLAASRPQFWSDMDPDFRTPPSNTSIPNSMSVRVDVRDSANGTSTEFLHVMGLNNAVSTAFRDDAAGQIGTRITLTDGRIAVLRFNTATPGGTIQIFDANSTQVEGGTLPTAVQTPPLYVTP